MLQKVAVNQLKVGMFVADLDRPWMDTPFLLQGFLLEDAEQIAQVQATCQWVMVDPLRSSGPEFDAQRNKKPEPIAKRDLGTDPIVTVQRVETPRPTPLDKLRAETGADALNRSAPSAKPGTQPKPGADARTNPKLREFAIPISQRAVNDPMMTTSSGMQARDPRTGGVSPGPEARGSSGGVRSLFGQLKENVKNLFSSAPSDSYDFDQYDVKDAPKVQAERPSFMPENVQLTIYEDKQPVENEIGAATEAYGKSQEILSKMVADIRSGNQMQVEVVETVIEDMVDSMVRNPDAMMWVARMREQSTLAYDHGLSVAIGLIAFGRHLGFPKDQLGNLGVMGLLLDIGKLRLPTSILEKTGRLTPEEFAEMKRHVEYSMDILYQTPGVNPDVLEGVAQHHERIDGSGYPYGLAGNNITIFGKMCAIADTYSAITKKRPYAEPASPHDALQMLSNWSGAQFQADMVEHFIQSIGVFPVGSLVELSTGEVAVIVSHNKQKRLRPKVLVVTEEDKTPRKHPTVKDLIYDVSDNPVYIRRGLPSNAYGIDPNEFYLG
jgi:HD-GYP domain-containing protein (c-di-GMP phosphodiesterase class II)